MFFFIGQGADETAGFWVCETRCVEFLLNGGAGYIFFIAMIAIRGVLAKGYLGPNCSREGATDRVYGLTVFWM